jgi:hypothetical protein
MLLLLFSSNITPRIFFATPFLPEQAAVCLILSPKP